LIPLVSAAFSSELDRGTRDEIGVPEAALMENAAAGMEAALESLGFLGREGPITALAGKGNNGGDALAILRRLAFHAPAGKLPELAVILSSGEPVGLAAAQLKAARNSRVRVLDWESDEDACRALLLRSSLILDGISGTGLSGALRPDQAALVEAANASGVPIAAIDVPSGAGDDTPEAPSKDAAVIRAYATLCVEPRKACLYRPALRPVAGKIISISGVFPASSGSDSSCFLLEPSDLQTLVPPFRPESHKYDRGLCLVFAGSVGATGAAILAARGATAGGAGLVALHVRPEIWAVTAAALTGEMVKPLPADAASLDLGRAKAAVAGPGWGRDDAASAVLLRLWASDLALVLDADALALLRDLDLPKRSAPTVLTPHPGEAAALSGRSASGFLSRPEELIFALARRWGAVVMLKSCVTWIASPEGRCAVYDGMDGFLAVGGSGDVLSGLCGALLARGMPAFDAACAAAMAHGLAGRKAHSDLGLYGADALPARVAKVLGELYG
jgi:ADP-dependent NAD(P)H-hydrate dehydratase / NAD(P)H-hydrate epimerase